MRKILLYSKKKQCFVGIKAEFKGESERIALYNYTCKAVNLCTRNMCTWRDRRCEYGRASIFISQRNINISLQLYL